MKKAFVKAGLLITILFSISLAVSSQIYVKIRPAVPVIVRTAPPASNYVWIEEEWEPYNGNYRYVGGHWEAPPTNGHYWHPGYWRHDKQRGNFWIKGKWGNGKGWGRRKRN